MNSHRYKNDNLAYIFSIKSSDRLQGDPEDFVVECTSFEGMVVKTMELNSVEIPNSIYPFTSSNNVITFNEGGGDLTATITAGSYSASQLATEIKTRMDAAGSDTYTITVNDNTKKMTIASTGTFTLKFSEDNSPYYELGFTNSDTSSAASHTGTNVVRLSGLDFIYLVIRNYTQMGSDSNGNSYSFKIPLNRPFDDIIFYTKNTGFDQTMYSQNTYPLQSQMTIKLFDPNGNSISLNGSEWACCLRITTYDNLLKQQY